MNTLLKTKNIRLMLALALVTVFTTLQSSSCSKSDDLPAATQVGIIAGTWKVSFYWDAKDETSKFTGYTFTFTSAGQVTAKNGASTVNGTWTESSTKLSFNFGADPVFSKLTNDWLKEEKIAGSIKLKNDNITKDERIQFVIN